MQPKNIIVTGASRGIGFELVKQLRQSGHQVLALSRNTDPLEKIDINYLAVDISNEEQINEVKEFVNKNWGHVDVLIHNAGRLINKPFSETSYDDFLSVYQVNVFGVAILTKVLLSYLRKGSHVLTISSMGGIQGSMKFPGLAAYSSSKGAVITLTELLAEEFKEQGIAFNALALGAVQTEMLEEAFPGFKAPNSPAAMAEYIGEFALKAHQFYNGKVLQVSSSTP